MPDEQFKLKTYEVQEISCKEDNDRNNKSGTVVAVISTDTIDRDNEVILPSGIDTTAFMKAGGPVLFAHDRRSPPVARAVWVRKGKDMSTLSAKMIFAATDRAQEVYTLIKDGFMKAFSVGLNPFFKGGDFGEPTSEEIQARPELKDVSQIYRTSELLEFSVVPVPANPEALAFAIGKGLGVSDAMQVALGIKEAPASGDKVSVIPRRKVRISAHRRSTVTGVRGQEWLGRTVEDVIARKTGRVVVSPK